MPASPTPLVTAAAGVLCCAALLGCGGSGATRTASGADTSASPSPVAGARTAAYPPPDPVTVVSCASSTGSTYCTDASGLRVSAVHAGESCHVAIDPAGVQSGSWRPLGAGDTHLACGAGNEGSACVVVTTPGVPPVRGSWDRLGACVTPARAGGPCGVDAHTHGTWTRVGGIDATPRFRCATSR